MVMLIVSVMSFLFVVDSVLVFIVFLDMVEKLVMVFGVLVWILVIDWLRLWVICLYDLFDMVVFFKELIGGLVCVGGDIGKIFLSVGWLLVLICVRCDVGMRKFFVCLERGDGEDLM